MSYEFSDKNINMKALRQRAFNLRWATLPQDVIPLTAADPDFQCAPEIAEAIKAYCDERVFSYGPGEGLPAFRQAVARTLNERRGLRTSAELVLPVDSAAQGMRVVADYVLGEGDEAIIFDPVDFLFATTVQHAGGVPVRLPLRVRDGAFDFEVLRGLVTPRTRLLCLCNPHNPSGKVFTRGELEALGNFAVEHGLWIMSDEIWSDIVFAPSVYTSIASLSPAIAARTFTIYGFSKSFAIAGLRVGFIVSPSAEVHEGIVQESLVRTTIQGVSTVSQVAAQAAFERCRYWVDEFMVHLTAMRDYAVGRLNEMKGVTCHLPQGCYLAFPDISATGKSSEEVTEYLLKQAKVAVVPGAARWFGPGAEGHVRICFSTSKTVLEAAMDRLESAFSNLN